MRLVIKCLKAFLLIYLLWFLDNSVSAQVLTKNQKDSSKKMIEVPNIVGLQLRHAKILLFQHGIGIGAIVGPFDSSNFYVYRQYPSPYKKNGNHNYIQKGQLIDIWVLKNRESIPVQNRNLRGVRANDYLDTSARKSL